MLSAMKIANKAFETPTTGSHGQSGLNPHAEKAIPMATALFDAALRDGEFSREIRDALLSKDS